MAHPVARLIPFSRARPLWPARARTHRVARALLVGLGAMLVSGPRSLHAQAAVRGASPATPTTDLGMERAVAPEPHLSQRPFPVGLARAEQAASGVADTARARWATQAFWIAVPVNPFRDPEVRRGEDRFPLRQLPALVACEPEAAREAQRALRSLGRARPIAIAAALLGVLPSASPNRTVQVIGNAAGGLLGVVSFRFVAEGQTAASRAVWLANGQLAEGRAVACGQ